MVGSSPGTLHGRPIHYEEVVLVERNVWRRGQVLPIMYGVCDQEGDW